MVTHARGSLGEAYDREDDKEVAGRILAVHYVRDRDMSPEVAADMVFASTSSVHSWLARHGEGGVDALRDLPRSGRPRLVGRGMLGEIIDLACRPYAKLAVVRERIRERTGVPCHPTTVRLRMREHGLSHKRAHPVHVSRASDPEVRKWQRDEGERIRRGRGSGG